MISKTRNRIQPPTPIKKKKQSDAERAREEAAALQEKLEKSQGEVYRLKAKLENAQGEQESLRQELEKAQSGVSRIHADRDRVGIRTV